MTTAPTEDAPVQIAVPAKVRSSVESFAAEHGGSASAVLQPIGRMGVRITLVGDDGVLGDRMVKDLATARAVVDAVPSVTATEEWERELVAKANPRRGHWAKMAGWVAKQKRFPKARNEK
ncbi:hypothetical protein OG921_18550 [Aldersonia sp. NBC_00410]|uniref:hypothetical protein n=1 Tax=Aldersonia sp. NBC_00410 TaxID=2975954 RepID=UPI00225A8EF1|nr:hypothetical protein [Aldersonia sp. NBC_00410]MCX5045170.1 hypothetical protein [Aldersonia sp. NBC_00410]